MLGRKIIRKVTAKESIPQKAHILPKILPHIFLKELGAD